MNVTSAASSGNIIDTPLLFVPNDGNEADLLSVNGVTDSALYHAGDQVADSLQWLDTLTPQQLSERTIGNFDEGLADTTYGQLKVYRQVETDLGNQENLLAQLGSGARTGSIAAGNPYDVQAVEVTNLLSNLQDNKPGAVAAAQTYLSTLASGQGPATVSTQSVLAAYQTESAFRAANPHGDWATPQEGSIALSILSGYAAVQSAEQQIPGHYSFTTRV